ncbi:hypothetical protein PMAYCL1PPCAC_30670, partial [Pristionchus mayeri]
MVRIRSKRHQYALLRFSARSRGEGRDRTDGSRVYRHHRQSWLPEEGSCCAGGTIEGGGVLSHDEFRGRSRTMASEDSSGCL